MNSRCNKIAGTLLDIFDTYDHGGIRFSWSGLKLVTGMRKITDDDVIAINKCLAKEFFALVPHSDHIDLRNLLDAEYGTSADAYLESVPMKLLKQYYPAGKDKKVREFERLHRQYLRREGFCASSCSVEVMM